MNDIYVYAYTGMGDCIWQRPFVRALSNQYDRVFFRTPWPEFYVDFKNVYPVKPDKDHRTQTDNIQRNKDFNWAVPPKGTPKIDMGYQTFEHTQLGVIGALEKQTPLKGTPFILDLPAKYKKCPINSKGKPIAVIRPPTVRKEWFNPARNTRIEYINYCAESLMKRGYYVVSIANLKEGEEWIVGKPTKVHEHYFRGELDVTQLMGLVKHAAITVGSAGWITPMALAAHTPLFVLWGGRGAFDRAETIFDNRMDLSKVGWAYPKPFCMCMEDDHNCNKIIPDLPKIFEFFVDKIEGKVQGITPKIGPAFVNSMPI